jgi:hypothetical protein
MYVHLHAVCSYTCMPYFMDSKALPFHISVSLKLGCIISLLFSMFRLNNYRKFIILAT